MVELGIHLCPPRLRCVLPTMLCLIKIGRMLVQLFDVLVMPHARNPRGGDVLVVRMVRSTAVVATETWSVAQYHPCFPLDSTLAAPPACGGFV